MYFCTWLVLDTYVSRASNSTGLLLYSAPDKRLCYRQWTVCTCHQGPQRPSKETPLHQATCTPLVAAITPRVTPSAMLLLPSLHMGSHLPDRRRVTKDPLVRCLLASRLLVSQETTSHPLARCHLRSPLWGSLLLGSLLRCHSSRHPVKGAVLAIIPLLQLEALVVPPLAMQVRSTSQPILVPLPIAG